MGEILICILAIVVAATLSIVLHEVSHGYVALKCGDPTAKLNNRLTLNPVAHFDILGLLMIIIVGFGWAKPVPIDPRNFRNYKKGMILVSVAGIITNILLCGLGLLLLFLISPIITYASSSTTLYALQLLLYYFLVFFIKINFSLAFFNLLPIYPLDGFRLVNCFLKPNNKFSTFMYKNGNYVLIGLIVVSMIFRNVGLSSLDIFTWGSYLINILIGLVS